MPAALAALALALSAAPPAVHIRGGTVYDGTGAPPFTGDVLIVGDRIQAVGPNLAAPVGAKVVNAARLAVCPGFIDLHTHCDTGSPGLTEPKGRPNGNYVLQGVSTVVTGNCGAGPLDAAAFFAKLEAGGVGTNVVHQVPHNAVRQSVMKNENRAPTADEQAKMEALVDKGMRDGCVGLATGLIYTPGTYSKTPELVGLAKVSGKYGGLYASHIRNEGEGLLDAVGEAIAIGEQSGCRVHVSHIKASGKANWGKSADAVALIKKARAAGLTVTADQYPYTASSTSLAATLVPTRFRDGTGAEYRARLADPVTGPRVRDAVAKALDGKDGANRVRIAAYSKNKAWNGKGLGDIAALTGKEPADVVMEIEANGGAQVVNFGMSEEDVRLYMREPWVATASDGSTKLPGDGVPHPRSYGTFPRKVGRYAVEDGVISVEQAVRSCSGLPADVLKLPNRGYLKADHFADVLVFDPKGFRDPSTFEKPHQLATGVRWLWVNGAAAVADGIHDPAALAGRVVRFGPGK